jgi:predicted SAM-dependent methyltransferase
MRKLFLFVFSHRVLALLRWDVHFLRIRLTNFALRKGQALRRFAAGRSSPVYLNLGSGPRGLGDSHWVNVDGFADRNVHFLIDFNRPLPFEDQSLDGAFCEHVLEHFTQDDGLRIMQEVRRCLKPGGVFRIVVPNGEWVMRTYFENPDFLVQHRLKGEGQAMEAVNSYFRQRYEHQFLYDWPTMEATLRKAGFSTVTKTDFNKSVLCPDICLDDEKYAPESLYVEAAK